MFMNMFHVRVIQLPVNIITINENTEFLYSISVTITHQIYPDLQTKVLQTTHNQTDLEI